MSRYLQDMLISCGLPCQSPMCSRSGRVPWGASFIAPRIWEVGGRTFLAFLHHPVNKHQLQLHSSASEKQSDDRSGERLRKDLGSSLNRCPTHPLFIFSFQIFSIPTLFVILFCSSHVPITPLSICSFILCSSGEDRRMRQVAIQVGRMYQPHPSVFFTGLFSSLSSCLPSKPESNQQVKPESFMCVMDPRVINSVPSFRSVPRNTQGIKHKFFFFPF